MALPSCVVLHICGKCSQIMPVVVWLFNIEHEVELEMSVPLGDPLDCLPHFTRRHESTEGSFREKKEIANLSSGLSEQGSPCWIELPVQ